MKKLCTNKLGTLTSNTKFFNPLIIPGTLQNKVLPQMPPQMPPQMNPQMPPQMPPQMNPQMAPQMAPQMTPQMPQQDTILSTSVGPEKFCSNCG